MFTIYYTLTLPYRLILWLRHKFYDWGIFKSHAAGVPVLSIGNITVGGTGKTPHTELVLRMFSQQMPIAVLSGGYKRKSKGFRYVGPADSVGDVGDEPLQMKRKFPDVVVAVDKNRIAGIAKIRQEHPEVRLVVLDDAFQYRRLKPAYSILLSDYHRPYPKDMLLPFGTLRDLPSQAKRADMIVVTKTPVDAGPEVLTAQYQTLCPKPWQTLLFSRYRYGTPQPIFPKEAASGLPERATQVVALTGIAHPQPFINEISKQAVLVNHLRFPDHHAFTQGDVTKINALALTYPRALIYTTEKDAMRLAEVSGLSPQAKSALYYIPIEVDFCTDREGYKFFDIIEKFSFFVSNPI